MFNLIRKKKEELKKGKHIIKMSSVNPVKFIIKCGQAKQVQREVPVH